MLKVFFAAGPLRKGRNLTDNRWITHGFFWLALVAFCVCLVFLSFLWNNDILFDALFHLKALLVDAAILREKILAYGSLAPLFFIGLQILQVILAPFPGEATGFLGGYIFGPWPCFIYSSIGLSLGSVTAFVISRLVSDLVIDRLQGTRVYRQFNDLVFRGDFMVPFLLFLFPGFPKDSLSYLLGTSRMPIGVFIFISSVGRMPGTLALAYEGAQVYEENYAQLVVLLIATTVVVAPCLLFRKRLLGWLRGINGDVVKS